MARIERTEFGFYEIELPQVLSDSMHGDIPRFEINLVTVSDADGASGCGYTFTAGRNGGAIHATLTREFTELLEGEEADAIGKIWQKLWWAIHYGGRGGAATYALSATDMALWDLKAKRAGLPLWRLLGGHDPKVPCYAGGVDLHLTLDQLLAQTERNLARGFGAIKMKVGRPDLNDDLERVRAMKELLGPIPLMVDANMKWTVDEAIRAARALRDLDVLWLEEPIVPDDPVGHARVLREGGMPIAAGENLRSLWEFRTYIEMGAVSFPEPDVTNCGGVSTFMKIGHLAEAFNLPVTSHGAHDVTVHLLASLPNRSYLEAHGFGLERYIEEPLVLRDGHAIAPERPGHGIVFDRAGLERVRAD